MLNNNKESKHEKGKEFYEYAHPVFSGRIDATVNSTGELYCKDIEPGDTDYSVYGIRTACKDRFPPLVLYRPTGSDDFKEGRADYIDACGVAYNPDTVVDWVPFNRKCTAIPPAEDREFVCYDMSPTTNADEYFVAYVNATEGFDASVGLHVYGTAVDGAVNEMYFIGGALSENVTYESEVFNATIAMYAIRSSIQFLPKSLGMACNSCGYTQFCGMDGQCHDFGCENIFLYGNSTWLGSETEVERNSDALNCTDTIQPGWDENGCYDGQQWPTPIAYACLNGWDEATDTWVGFGFLPCEQKSQILASMPLNRMCTADLPTSTFICYDMNPATDFDTYFADFVNVSMQIGPSCEPPADDPNLATYYFYTTYNYVTCIQTSEGGSDCTYNSETGFIFDAKRAATQVQSSFVTKESTDGGSSSGGASVLNLFSVCTVALVTTAWIVA